MNCPLLQDNPLWSASVLRTNPEVVRDIHLDFLRAGAEVVITATYSVFNSNYCSSQYTHVLHSEHWEMVHI